MLKGYIVSLLPFLIHETPAVRFRGADAGEVFDFRRWVGRPPAARTNKLATNGTGRRDYSQHLPKEPSGFTDEDGYRLYAAENKRARRAAKRVADMERAEARKARQGGPVRHDENGAPVYHVGARLP